MMPINSRSPFLYLLNELQQVQAVQQKKQQKAQLNAYGDCQVQEAQCLESGTSKGNGATNGDGSGNIIGPEDAAKTPEGQGLTEQATDNIRPQNKERHNGDTPVSSTEE